MLGIWLCGIVLSVIKHIMCCFVPQTIRYRNFKTWCWSNSSKTAAESYGRPSQPSKKNFFETKIFVIFDLIVGSRVVEPRTHWRDLRFYKRWGAEPQAKFTSRINLKIGIRPHPTAANFSIQLQLTSNKYNIIWRVLLSLLVFISCIITRIGV